MLKSPISAKKDAKKSLHYSISSRKSPLSSKKHPLPKSRHRYGPEKYPIEKLKKNYEAVTVLSNLYGMGAQNEQSRLEWEAVLHWLCVISLIVTEYVFMMKESQM